MKKKIIIVSLFIIIFVLPSLLFFLGRSKARNIFEEMYYNEYSSATSWVTIPKYAWRNIKGVKGTQLSDADGELLLKETYTSTGLPNEIRNLSLSFYTPPKIKKFSKERSVGVVIIVKEAQTTLVKVEYHYQLYNRTLRKTVSLVEDTSSKQLEKNNEILLKNSKRADQILKEKVLKDWTSVYPSRFTPTNWGDVKVVDEWDKP